MIILADSRVVLPVVVVGVVGVAPFHFRRSTAGMAQRLHSGESANCRIGRQLPMLSSWASLVASVVLAVLAAKTPPLPPLPPTPPTTTTTEEFELIENIQPLRLGRAASGALRAP